MSQGYQPKHDAGPGSVLADARQELDLSVVEVARHLKLSPAQVEALEAGQYERLPGRVFVRGVLRNYAKLLGLDPQPLLRSIEPQIAQSRIPEARPASTHVVMPRERAARWPLYSGLAAALIVGALAVYEFGFNEPPRSAGSDTSAASAPEPVFPPGAEPPGAVPTSAPTAVSEGAAQSGAALAVAPAVPTNTVAAANEPPARPRAGPHELYFKFDEESLVEVRDRNDRVLISRLNPAGSEERINVAPPLKLVIGNARGVKVTYGDEPVDLTPYTAVSVARLTIK